jgi:hypothetical protein
LFTAAVLTVWISLKFADKGRQQRYSLIEKAIERGQQRRISDMIKGLFKGI